jgi:hypothetical protein
MRGTIPPLLHTPSRPGDELRVNSKGASLPLPLPLPPIYAKIFVVSLPLKFLGIFLYENIQWAIMSTLHFGQKSFSFMPM